MTISEKIENEASKIKNEDSRKKVKRKSGEINGKKTNKIIYLYNE